jgi:hypothetical protein
LSQAELTSGSQGGARLKTRILIQREGAIAKKIATKLNCTTKTWSVSNSKLTQALGMIGAHASLSDTSNPVRTDTTSSDYQTSPNDYVFLGKLSVLDPNFGINCANWAVSVLEAAEEAALATGCGCTFLRNGPYVDNIALRIAKSQSLRERRNLSHGQRWYSQPLRPLDAALQCNGSLRPGASQARVRQIPAHVGKCLPLPPAARRGSLGVTTSTSTLPKKYRKISDRFRSG